MGVEEFVRSIGGTIDRDGNSVEFWLAEYPGIVGLKAGGARFWGFLTIEPDVNEDEATAWIKRQPSPECGVLELFEADGGAVLGLSFERPTREPDPEPGRLLAELAVYAEAWDERADVAMNEDVPPYVLPGDPRDQSPRNAWLLMGQEPSWPNGSELRRLRRQSDAGVFDNLWTAAKQTEVGDLLFFYFLAPHKAIHFVARAASPAYYDATIGVNARAARDEQWWTETTEMIPIEPIPFSAVAAAQDGQLILRGRSGRYMSPGAVSRLNVRALHHEDQERLDRVLAPLVGRADLPLPAETDWSAWKVLAAGAMRLEADVSHHLVGPLLRMAGASDVRPEYPAAGGKVDFAVLRDGLVTCAVEVKLSIRRAATGQWPDCRDFQQLLHYMADHGSAGILLDAHQVALVRQGETLPYRVFERHEATAEDLAAVRLHVSP